MLCLSLFRKLFLVILKGYYIFACLYLSRGGGQSHSGGDAYVRLKRPPFSASLSPKDPSFFIIACALTQRPHKFYIFLSPNAKFHSPNEKNRALTKWPLIFRPIRPHIFGFFSNRMPKIMLSPNDPSFFEPVLSPNAPACRSAGLTPVSISNMTAPPPGYLFVLFVFFFPSCLY